MTKVQDLDTAALPLAASVAEAGKTWYFAYGSNMRSAVMQNRGVMTLATEIVVVPSHVLSFDVFGVPYSEPAMASITLSGERSRPPDHVSNPPPPPPPPVHGVAFLVSRADYVRLLVSEGAGTAYEEVELEAIPIPIPSRDGGEVKAGCEDAIINVHTLVARYSFRPNFPPRPSARYMTLLIEGAAEHDLPAAYQTYLQSLPTFTKVTSTRATIGASIFHFLWLPPIQRVMRWIKGTAMVENGRSPRWTGTVVWIIFRAMWLHHDWIHARIWARGDGRLTSKA